MCQHDEAGWVGGEWGRILLLVSVLKQQNVSVTLREQGTLAMAARTLEQVLVHVKHALYVGESTGTILSIRYNDGSISLYD